MESKVGGTPIKGRVVLKKVKLDNQKTESGIIMGSGESHLETFGEVMATGEKVESVVVGDTVLYNGLAVKEFMLKGKEYLLAPEEAIYLFLDRD